MVGSPSFRIKDEFKLIPTVTRADLATGGPDRIRIKLSAQFGTVADVMSVRTYPKPEVGRTTTGLSVQFVAREKISLDRGVLHNDAFRLLTVSSMFSSHDTYDANVLRYEDEAGVVHTVHLGDKTPRSAHMRTRPVPLGRWFELVKEPGSRWFADSPSICVDIHNRKAVPIRLGLQGYLLDKKDPNEDSWNVWIEWLDAPEVIEPGCAVGLDVTITATPPRRVEGGVDQEVMSQVELLDDPDPDVRRRAIDALGRLGPRAVAPLTELLVNSQPFEVRRSAADALARIGPEAREAVSALGDLLERGPDISTRLSAATALWAIGPEARDAAEDLQHALGDDSWEVRRSAADALARIGPGAAAAVDELAKLLVNSQPFEVRRSAADALARIGPWAYEKTTALVERLREDDSWEVRRSAADALAQIGPRAVDSIDNLGAALGDPRWEVRRSVADALARIGPVEAYPYLQKHLPKEKVGSCRQSIIDALARAGAVARGVVPELVGLIGDGETWEVRRSAVDAIGQIDEKQLIAQSGFLIGLIRDADQNRLVVRSAIDALARIPGELKAKKAVGDLKTILKASEQPWEVRRSAADALTRMGADTQKADEELIEKKADEELHEADDVLAEVICNPDARWELRFSAARALAAIGPRVYLIDKLIGVLGDPDWFVSREVSKALAKVGRPAVGPLINVLLERPATGSDEFDRAKTDRAKVGAANSLREIEDGAETALPALTLTGVQGDHEVGPAAAEAAKQINRKLVESAGQASYWDLRRHINAIDEILKTENGQSFDAGHGNFLTETRAKLVEYKVQSWWNWFLNLMNRNPWTYFVVAIWAAVWVISLLLPSTLLRLSEWLKRRLDFKFKLFELELKLEAFIRGILAVSWFDSLDRVLDAWVAKHAPRAEALLAGWFADRGFADGRTGPTTLDGRSGPATLDGHKVDALSSDMLRPIFSQERFCLMTRGHNCTEAMGLARLIAQWAMSDDKTIRPCDHRMLPVPVERIDPAIGKGVRAFVETIRGQLRDLIHAPNAPSEGLLEALLRRRRVLVVVDGSSEQDPLTPNQIGLGWPDFPANAMLLASLVDGPTPAVEGPPPATAPSRSVRRDGIFVMASNKIDLHCQGSGNDS